MQIHNLLVAVSDYYLIILEFFVSICRYGDLTPRAIVSRVFAIIWIFIGMVNFAIFVGALTTAITATQVHSDAKIYGVEVCLVEFAQLSGKDFGFHDSRYSKRLMSIIRAGRRQSQWAG